MNSIRRLSDAASWFLNRLGFPHGQSSSSVPGPLLNIQGDTSDLLRREHAGSHLAFAPHAQADASGFVDHGANAVYYVNQSGNPFARLETVATANSNE